MKTKLSTLMWTYKQAWRINKILLIILLLLTTAAAVLPAIALSYQRAIIDAIGSFIATGDGTFSAVLPTIITFGIILTLVGLSNRLNYDLMYTLVYDKYYVGIVEKLSDGIMNYPLEELMVKSKNDDFHAATYKTGAFNHTITGSIGFVSSLIGTIALLVVASRASMLVFVIALLFMIGTNVYNAMFNKRLEKRFDKAKGNHRLAQHYFNLTRNPEAAREIRVFGLQKHMLDKWEKSYRDFFAFRKKENLTWDLRSFFSGLIFNIFVGAMTIYALFSLYNGNLEVGALLVIFTLTMNISGSIGQLSGYMGSISYGLHVMKTVREICDRKPPQPISAENALGYDTDNLFETKGLNYAYPGGNVALDDVSLSIKKGETIALVGVNGSGKSTLVNILLQLFRPKGGELYFDGQNYDTLEEGFLKNKIGAFFQDYCLFHLPIHENIGFGDIDHIEDRERITEALKKGGAYDFVQKLPKGEDTYIDRQVLPEGVIFSGGERQKLGVSRAHISDKDILIFDEPASMLDPLAELEQFEHIKQKAEGRTTILISHRVGFARMADRIVLLDGGKIAEVGTHAELMKQGGLYANFFNEQAQWYVG